MASVTFIVPDGSARQLDVRVGQILMQGAIRQGVPGILAECGGSCSCATCHVYVDEAWVAKLPKPQSDEADLLRELPDYREPVSRLSCQVDFTDSLSGIKVAIAPDS